MVIRIIADLIQLYIIVLFVRLILSWFPMNPWSPWAKVARGLAKVTDPVLVPLRRVVPPLRVGAMALDLSPLIVLVGLEIILSIVRSR